MNLAGMAEILENAGVGVRGRTIFVNNMPADAPTAVLLRPSFGGTPIDHELPGFVKGSFMLIVRAKRYEEGETLMKAAMTALTRQDEFTDAGMRVNYLRPQHEPLVYAPSRGGLVEFTTDIDACYVAV